MIEKVYDETGQLVHDCEAAGCSVSWDGYARIAHEFDDLSRQDSHGNPVKVKLNKGDRVPGAQDPDAAWWDVSNGEATRRKDRDVSG